MKQGRTLSQLAAEIERQQAAKIDYVADTRKLLIEVSEAGRESAPATEADQQKARPDVRLIIPNGKRHEAPITALAHRQIGERVGIPAKYYEHMLNAAPHLLATNVNHWFRENPEQRLVRTLDGNARAFLSNKYQRIDNAHIAETVLPILADTRGLEVVSCEVTERRLYIKAKSTEIRAEVKGSRRVGDVVEAGIVISNSEVGLGAVSVQPFYFFLACLNGMVRNRDGLRAAHIGTRMDSSEELAAILADDTRKVLDRGVLLKVRDVVRSLLNPEQHQLAVDRMSEQTAQVIKGDPAKAIEVLANELAIGEGERGSILRHLIEGGDLSRFGVMNAITRTGEDAQSYDRATELETLGGRLLDLPAANWERIAIAA